MTNGLNAEQHQLSDRRIAAVQQDILPDQQKFPGASGEAFAEIIG